MSLSKLPCHYVVSYVYLFIATVIWSAATPIIKMTLSYIPPFTFLFIRFLIVCVILLPFTIYQLQQTKINKKDIPVFIMLGLFAQSSLILVFIGLKYTSALDTALLGILGTLLSMSAGHYFYNDTMNKGVKTGTIITILGVIVVSFEPLLTGTNNGVSPLLRVYGNFLVILSHIAFLVYIIWIKISLSDRTGLVKKTLHFLHMRQFTKQYDQSLITSLNFFVALASMTPFAFMENLGAFGNTQKADFSSPEAVFGLLFMALLSSIVAYFLFEKAVKCVTITDSALMAYIQPLFTIPFAYLLLKEIPTVYGLKGGFIMLCGVIMAEIASHKHLQHKKRLQQSRH